MAGTQFLIVLGSGAFLLGLACVIWISLLKQRGHGIANWPKTVGQVKAVGVSELERETPDGIVSTFTPIIRYEYAVAGEVFQGRRFGFVSRNVLTSRRRADADRMVSKYSADSEVDVFYNAANHSQAALFLPKPIAHNAVLFYGVTNVVTGMLIIALGIVLLSR